MIGGLVGCSKEDEPGGGEGAMYQVTVEQSGEYRSYIKSVVVAANGTTVVNENTGEKFKGNLLARYWRKPSTASGSAGVGRRGWQL